MGCLSEHKVREGRGLVVELVVGQELVQVTLAAGVVVVSTDAGVAGDLGAVGAGVGSTWPVAEATAGGDGGGGLGFRMGVWQPLGARVLLPQRGSWGQAVMRSCLAGEGSGLGSRGAGDKAVTALAGSWATGQATVRTPSQGRLFGRGRAPVVYGVAVALH